MSVMTKTEVLCKLEEMAEKAGTRTRLAKKLGVSNPYLSQVLNEKIELGPIILEQMGLERIVLYVEKGND